MVIWVCEAYIERAVQMIQTFLAGKRTKVFQEVLADLKKSGIQSRKKILHFQCIGTLIYDKIELVSENWSL